MKVQGRLMQVLFIEIHQVFEKKTSHVHYYLYLHYYTNQNTKKTCFTFSMYSLGNLLRHPVAFSMCRYPPMYADS